MQVALTEGFQRDVRALDGEARAAVFEALLGIPLALGTPHAHAGLGLRKLHRSGIWEARVGLGLRIVFALKENSLTLARVGTHDEIRRYLRTL
jgi:mRNA-degrading endonuclease YafQ of YafQ-DinJ toxin-antitoxin module